MNFIKKHARAAWIIAGLLTLITGGFLVFTLMKTNYWKRQDLNEYTRSCGGNMNGNSRSVSLSVLNDEHALLTFSEAEWYFQDPEVSEYLIGRNALTEIKDIFLKYRMYRWEGKSFSPIRIDDGETESHRFKFTDDAVRFSSQVFPARCRRKLDRIDEVIEKYRQNGELLPGLVLPQIRDEELLSKQHPEDGTVRLEVYEYSRNRLCYRVCNGTENQITCAGHFRLCTKDGKELASDPDSKLYINIIYPGEIHEGHISLTDRLAAGKYQLQVENCSCEFEIK